MSDGVGLSKRSPYYNDKYSRPEPMVDGWQLIGDSQFLRYYEKLLHGTRKKKNGLAYMGLCVSGQKTCELLERIQKNFHPVAERVIVMIGTNDLLKGTNSAVLRDNIQKLIFYLMTEAKVENIIILTIPPVPRLAKSSEHWKTLKAYNEHIKYTFRKGEGIQVIDAYDSFIKSNELSRNSSSSSRSSLVSYSSGYSSPLLRTSNNSLNIPVSTSNFDKIRTNLRIQVGEISKDRKIFVLSSDEEENDKDYDTEEEDCNTSLRKKFSNLKRSSSSSNFTTPNPKRRSCGSGSYNIAQDDHNDDYYSDDDSSNTPDEADSIILDYFEEFFDTGRKRQDLIHLNTKGLRVIDKLIRDAIDA